jgi:hypothetical protein
MGGGERAIAFLLYAPLVLGPTHRFRALAEEHFINLRKGGGRGGGGGRCCVGSLHWKKEEKIARQSS